MADLELDGRGRKTLVDALVAAFPSRAELKCFVAFHLNQNLDVIVAEGPLGVVAFELQQWASACGRLRELVDAAYAEKPGNPALAALVDHHVHSATPPASVRAEGSVRWTPDRMYDALLRLLPVQFEDVILRLAVPTYYLPPSTAPVAERAQGLMRLLEQQSRLGDLATQLDRLKLSPR